MAKSKKPNPFAKKGKKPPFVKGGKPEDEQMPMKKGKKSC